MGDGVVYVTERGSVAAANPGDGVFLSADGSQVYHLHRIATALERIAQVAEFIGITTDGAICVRPQQ